MKLNDEIEFVEPFRCMGLNVFHVIFLISFWIVTLFVWLYPMSNNTFMVPFSVIVYGVATGLLVLLLINLTVFFSEKFLIWPMFIGHYIHDPKFDSERIAWMNENIGRNRYLLTNVSKEISEISVKKIEFIQFKTMSDMVKYKLKYS